MLPFNLPSPTLADVQVFTRASTVTNTQWMTWVKPPGRSMLYVLCIGGGGGGGAGHTAASGNRGGGGGGGSSATTRVLVACAFLPDVLYIQVGGGGAPGGSGILSYVAILRNTTASNVLAVSGAAVASGGTNGSAGASGSGGTAGTIAAIGAMPLAGRGHFEFIAGQIGVAGGSQAGAPGNPAIIATTSILTMGGGGGAGTSAADFAGGTVTAIAGSRLSEMRPEAAPAGSNNGSGGWLCTAPFFSFAGMGAASSNAGVGGQGGDGGPGSGGGGGGGGTTGGTGGRGGAGIVILVAW